jgi:hypothetical protein
LDLTGENYEGIEFIDDRPKALKHNLKQALQYDAWKSEQDAAKAAAKEAQLDRLGLTAR